MSRSGRLRSYWFEAATVAVGVATGACVAPLGAEAVFSVAALAAAALSASTFAGRRRVLA